MFTAILVLLIVILFLKVRSREQEQLKKRHQQWVYHDWHGTDTSEQRKVAEELIRGINSGRIKTRSLQDIIDETKSLRSKDDKTLHKRM